MRAGQAAMWATIIAIILIQPGRVYAQATGWFALVVQRDRFLSSYDNTLTDNGYYGDYTNDFPTHMKFKLVCSNPESDADEDETVPAKCK
jgi:hypothetical protein